jgi:hypothetical protein
MELDGSFTTTPILPVHFLNLTLKLIKKVIFPFAMSKAVALHKEPKENVGDVLCSPVRPGITASFSLHL